MDEAGTWVWVHAGEHRAINLRHWPLRQGIAVGVDSLNCRQGGRAGRSDRYGAWGEGQDDVAACGAIAVHPAALVRSASICASKCGNSTGLA